MSEKLEVVCESGVCLYNGYDGLEETRRKYYSEMQPYSAPTDAMGGGVMGPTESATPKGCLRVKLPVGYVDKETANGNLYEMEEVNRSFEKCQTEMSSGLVQGCHGEHPKDRADLRPDEISHLVTKAWVDPSSKMIWNEWLVIPTQKGGGKDLIELFLAGASIGTSIRGLAVRESGKYMRNYTYKGTDTVAIPSTGIRPGTKNENVRATILYESLSQVSESLGLIGRRFDMTSPAAPVLKDELKSISESLRTFTEGKGSPQGLLELGAKLGSVEAQLESLQNDNRAKTGVADDLKGKLAELNQIKESLESERDKAIVESKSFKKTVKDLMGQVQILESELTKRVGSLNTSFQVMEEMRTRFHAKETGVSGTKLDGAVATIESLRDYAVKAEDVIEEAKKYIFFLENAVDTVRDHAVKSESILVEVVGRYQDQDDYTARLVNVIEALRDKANGVGTPAAKSVSMEAYIKHMLDKYPQLKRFTEELRDCSTVAQLHRRVSKYMDMVDKSGAAKIASESVDETKADQKKGTVEKMLGGWK